MKGHFFLISLLPIPENLGLELFAAGKNDPSLGLALTLKKSMLKRVKSSLKAL